MKDSALYWRRDSDQAQEHVGQLGVPETIFLVLCIYLLAVKRSTKNYGEANNS